MGVPYSKQINAAFDQVTPLVSSGYEILETVKNIAIFITVIQIGIIGLLALNFLALLGLLFSLNPDLEKERKTLVTPAIKWIANWMVSLAEMKYFIISTFLGLLAVVGSVYSIYVYHARHSAEDIAEEFGKREEDLPEEDNESKSGENDGSPKET